jgi:hypothetical protein
VTGSGLSDLVTPMSALPFTVVEALPELLPLTGSAGALLETLAVFVMTAPSAVAAATVATNVTVADAPALIAPNVHVTVEVPEHVPWDGVEETNVVPEGSVSVMFAAVAWFGPRLFTVIVHVMLAPAFTVAAPDFSTCRSAFLLTAFGLIETCLSEAPSMFPDTLPEAPGQEEAEFPVPHWFSRERWAPHAITTSLLPEPETVYVSVICFIPVASV